ncbi:hypothetical protein REPUB_Repub05bG0077900 [Reevesia pubescens]
MAEGLDDFWAKLKLTEAEQQTVHVEHEWMNVTADSCRHHLMGKLFSRKFANVEAMKLILSQVQLHGLSVGMYSKKMGIAIEESIGDVLEVDISDDLRDLGKALQARIMIDVTKPLKRGTKVVSSHGDSIMILFRYEKMLDIYFAKVMFGSHASIMEINVEITSQEIPVKDMGINVITDDDATCVDA